MTHADPDEDNIPSTRRSSSSSARCRSAGAMRTTRTPLPRSICGITQHHYRRRRYCRHHRCHSHHHQSSACLAFTADPTPLHPTRPPPPSMVPLPSINSKAAATPDLSEIAYVYKAASSWFYSGVWKKRSLALAGSRLSYTKLAPAADANGANDSSAGSPALGIRQRSDSLPGSLSKAPLSTPERPRRSSSSGGDLASPPPRTRSSSFARLNKQPPSINVERATLSIPYAAFGFAPSEWLLDITAHSGNATWQLCFERHEQAVEWERALVEAGASFLQGAARHADTHNPAVPGGGEISVVAGRDGGGSANGSTPPLPQSERDRLNTSAGSDSSWVFMGDMGVPGGGGDKNDASGMGVTFVSESPTTGGKGGGEGLGGGEGGKGDAYDTPTGNTIPQTPGMPADVVPTRYVVGCGGDTDMAAARWSKTHAWRTENDIDGLLHEPHPHIEFYKSKYAHFFHRRAKNGHVVYYDRMDGAVYKSLVDRASLKALERHYMFVSEFAYAVLEPEDPGGRMVNVYDLSKLTFSALFGPSCELAVSVTKLCQAHYPERADKVFIVNAPMFFSALWKIISPIMDPRTKVGWGGGDGCWACRLLGIDAFKCSG